MMLSADDLLRHMMESFFPLITAILTDHGAAINAILLIAAGAFGWLYFNTLKQTKNERDELLEMFKKHVERDREELLKVLERYQQGQINVIQALNEIRLLIATIGTKL